MLRHLGQAVAAVADGHVTGEARERALAHLAICPQCRAEVEGHRAMRHRLAALASPDLPAAMTARLLGLSVGSAAAGAATAGAGSARAGTARAATAGAATAGAATAHAATARVGAGRTSVRVNHGRRRVVAAGVLAAAALGTGAVIGVRGPAAGGGSGPTITPGSLELTRFDTTTRSMVLDDQGPALAVAADH